MDLEPYIVAFRTRTILLGSPCINILQDPHRNPQNPNTNTQTCNPCDAPPPVVMAYSYAASQVYAGFSVGPYAHTAPGLEFPGQPGHLPSGVPPPALIPFAAEWITTTPTAAASLSQRAVVAGYEAHDHSPLWVIRARHEGDLVPGKLAINHKAAYVPWNGKENPVNNIERKAYEMLGQMALTCPDAAMAKGLCDLLSLKNLSSHLPTIDT
ncbi:hypothetical protein EVAR_9585_1 [Eumeta japonica]|uniref:Uncharacterized protein n=1 Tax=Eumeta variegata TaxID=151549 RepID=A0A4C1TKU5_EUMVA|nr:hypothetical protein EVAR_9585_1 [Eumeta japonica]